MAWQDFAFSLLFRKLFDRDLSILLKNICCRQGWVQWSLSGMSSILGHVPSKEQPPASPAHPTQEQLAELYDALDINQQDLQDGKESTSKLEIVADIKVSDAASYRCPWHCWL